MGEKRWWTAAHGNASLHFDATLPTAAWIDSALGGDPLATPPEGVCAFTQLPGEIVVVPGLQHATYNMAAYTVGYSRQDRCAREVSVVLYIVLYIALLHRKLLHIVTLYCILHCFILFSAGGRGTTSLRWALS